MANYNKTFNFKNGVQVDVDKFIVRGSLVGIGTSIPGETFDVVGNIRTAGLVTTTNLNVTGFATFNQVRIGAVQLSASSGVITATAFYGDGATLSNLPTSQWVDVDVGLGFTSIYAAGNVGVNTLDPRFSLQVGANPLNNLPGVGINSNGNIISTGIISATAFVGAGYGITALNASNFSSGAFPPTLLPVIPNDKLGPNLQLGIITATNQFYGNLTGIAQSAASLVGNINVIVGFVTSVNLDVGIISAQNVTVHTNLNVGLNGSVLNANTNGRVGIGTTLGTADLQIRKNSNSLLEIISETSYARIAIGQSVQGVGAANSSSLIRYGYSPKELDFINNDTGDINMYLHAGGAGINTGAFRWIYGQTNSEKMALTYDGKLGLGITNPSNTLHVVGTSTVTGNSYIGGDLSVSNDLIAGGLTISNGTISNATISGSFSGTITGNINSTSGVSTFYQIQSTSSANLNTAVITNSIGIGTTALTYPLQINSGSNIIIANQFGTLGLGTDIIATSTIYNVTLDSSQGVGYFQGVGVGTTNPSCFADFSNAGNNIPVLGSAYQFMLPPKITTTERSSLVVVEGAFIHNKTINGPQYYNGTRWFNITSTDGNSANAGFSTFARWAGISTIASVAGFATVSTQAGISTTVSGGIANVTTLQVTGVSTFTNGPVRIGTGITLTSGNANFTGVVTATNFVGNGSGLTGIIASGTGIVIKNNGSLVGTASTIDFGTNLSVSAISAGVVTVTASGGSSGVTTYASLSGIATYATSSGYASTAGIATYATSAGIATYATSAGIATYTSEWILGAVGSADYTFTGPGFTGAESDPVLYLVKGQQYKFTNTMGAHPFRIQSTVNGSTGTQYNDGIANNDVSNGTLTWNVQFDAPNILYYQCTAHGGMGGKIYIIDAGIGPDISINTTGIITASSFSGNASSATFATSAGIATYASTAGISTVAQNLTGSPNITVSSVNSSGVVTASSFSGSNTLKIRTTITGVTTSITNNGIGNTDITGFKSYALMKVGLSTAGWLRLYTDSTSRTNDASRSVGIDPTPGSGVIAEVVTTGITTTQIITPFVMGGNLNNPADTTIYAAITNLSGVTTSISAQLTLLQLEA